MTRKPPMAPEDDQTRRFAVQPCLVPTPEAELLRAIADMRFALKSFEDPLMPDILGLLDALEASLRPKPRRSAFRR